MRKPDDVTLAWYKMKRKSNTLILVEDQVSAIKLSPHCHAAALLGVMINDAKAEEIKAGGYDNVIISLDNDATHEAIKLQLKWRRKIKGLQVFGLGKDIKNMNKEEFDKYVSQNVS